MVPNTINRALLAAACCWMMSSLVSADGGAKSAPSHPMRAIAFARDRADDQVGQVKVGYLDYLSAEIKACPYGRLFLTLELSGPPPQRPVHDIGYIWRMDTDLVSPANGQRVNDIGSDFNIRICYYPGKTQGWEVHLDPISFSPCPFWVDPSCWWDDNRVTVELLLLSNPPAADFRAVATVAAPQPYGGDTAPDQGHLDIRLAPDPAIYSNPVYLTLRQVARQPSNTKMREKLAQSFASAGMAADANREWAKLRGRSLVGTMELTIRTGKQVEVRMPRSFADKADRCDLVDILDRAYAFMQKFACHTPWEGDTQVFSYSESVPQYMATAGNPINVGINFWNGGCQDIVRALLHEMGHSFTCFGQAPLARWLSDSFGFREALASLLGTRCARAIADQTGNGLPVGAAMASVYTLNTQQNHEEAAKFLAHPPGNRPSGWEVPLHHWAFLRVMESEGWGVFDRFLATFAEAARSGAGIGQLQPRSVAQKNAALAAVLDFCAGRRTSSDWGYLGIPMDEGFYQRTIGVLTGRGVAAD
jgi:hypothetical protein